MNNEQTLHDIQAMVSLIKETGDERNKNIETIDTKVNKLGAIVFTMNKKGTELDDKLQKQAEQVNQLISVEEDIHQVSTALSTRVEDVSDKLIEQAQHIEVMNSNIAELGELNKQLAGETRELVTTRANDQMERTDALKANIAQLTSELKSLDKTDELAEVSDILKRIQDKTQEAIERNKQSETVFKSAIDELTAQISRVESQMNDCIQCYEDVRTKASDTGARVKAIEYMVQAICEEAKSEEPEQTDESSETDIIGNNTDIIKEDDQAEVE